MTTIDEIRTVNGVQKLLAIATALRDAEMEEAVQERQAAVKDAWTLLQSVPSNPDAKRLMGIVKTLQGENEQAVQLLYEALAAGDLTAMVRLEALLREVDRNGEADQIASRIRDQINRGNADVLWSLYRDAEHSLHEESQQSLRLITSAAAGGNRHAAVEQAMVGLDQGNADALARLRAIIDFPDAAAALGKFLSRFDLMDIVSSDDELSESQRLLRAAHEQGSLEATLWLWLKTDPPEDREFGEILHRYLISEDRAKHLGSMMSGGAGLVIANVAQNLIEAEQELVALRLLQASSSLGYDDAIPQLGSMLQGESGNEGPWAVLGAFLNAWPQMIRSDLVGAPDFPLNVIERAPALRDDHSAALAIDDSDFARRIREVLEQVGWTMHELGDHLLVGYWRVESGPIQIYIEVAGGLDRDRSAHISTPLLVGLDGLVPPWAAPLDLDADVDGWDLLLAGGARSELTSVTSFADSFTHPQRRVFEALFRLGENSSREYYLEPMGFFGMSLGGMLGRRLTFDGAPERLYPQAWASASHCDYISTVVIHEVPEIHRCENPLEVLSVGYTLSADLSGGHLRGVISGAIQSLMVMQDYVTQMFDSEPAIFNEIFNAIPMTRILNHRDLFEGDVPDIESAIRGTESKAREAMGAMKERRHALMVDPDADPVDINNAAWQLLRDGFLEQALVGFDRAASYGQPNALATLTWQLMLADRAEHAVQVYEDYFPRIENWMGMQDEFIQEETFSQIANSKSNAALAYLALDQAHTALRMWEEAAAADHIEAKAYPAVLAARDGDDRRARKMLRKLTANELAKFRADMDEVFEGGSGWFAAWARDALELISRV